MLLHGLGATLFTWRFVAASLAKEYEVIQLDLLGCGASPKPRDGDYSIHGQSSLLEGLLLQRNLRDVTLVGHSFGGAIALFTALRLRATDRIGRLVLIDAPAYAQPLPLFIRALRSLLGPLLTRVLPTELQVRVVLKLAYFKNKDVSRESVRVYAEALRSTGARHALVQTARALIPPDIAAICAQYGDLRLPCLVIWGEHDAIVPLTTGRRLARDMPRASLAIIERAGHLPQEERAKATIQALSEFLDQG